MEINYTTRVRKNNNSYYAPIEIETIRGFKIKEGDQIEVEAMGTKFTYQVTELKIISPSDVSVINPPDPLGRFISLMTCVPPGLNLKRLVVLGKMI